ncbi:MAG: hypothetical protein K6C94_08875 [Candidatus Gastranaerophilales bacterium]|nr:hypothetical protein [Candidatus Gastranaerophilales bacterium]
MFENFDEKYSSVTKLFKAMVEKNDNKVPNSLIFYGPDVFAQYNFAMLLARGANCTGDKTQNCDCQNCRWIKANEHPEVMTVSKINSKSEHDTTKTVISINQMNMIKDKLVISSDYHRFFIFCDAEERPFTKDEEAKYKNFAFLEQNFPKAEKENWVPLGLTKKSFTDLAANSLLKSIEEPPENVTFIFLSENAANIISTVVSRSQVFYIPGNSKQVFEYDFLTEILKNYPKIDVKMAVSLSDFLLKYSEENNKSMSEIIFSIQTYLKELLKQNSGNILLKKKILSDIENLQKANLMLKNSFKDIVAADEIAYILTK